ncbi:polysaccharide biosynthesis protein [Bifidobacterium animalis subsp. animalis]|nr:polysaccharide biosynthesis protein [Bifidobacterium animalis subsp. animalis]
MSLFRNLPDRLFKIASAAKNCTVLLGPKVAACGIVYHCTHKFKKPYYTLFNETLWRKVMVDVPFDSAAMSDLPAHNDGPIWVAWWQGLNDQTPPVILACIDSIKRHANGREVIVITKDNYTQYAEIDPILVKRRDEGTLTINAFCNALRVKLLYLHGGVWLDSTLYLTQDLSDDFSRYSFYSIKSPHADYPWTTYCLASAPGNPFMEYIYRCFVAVFTKIKAVPEYFLFDAFIYNAYTHIPQVTRMIDRMPLNNSGSFDLSEQLELTAGEPQLPADTYINKLTYKIKYPTRIDGKPTVFQRVLDGEL